MINLSEQAVEPPEEPPKVFLWSDENVALVFLHIVANPFIVPPEHKAVIVQGSKCSSYLKK